MDINLPVKNEHNPDRHSQNKEKMKMDAFVIDEKVVTKNGENEFAKNADKHLKSSMESETLIFDRSVKDRYNVVLVTMFLFGISSLLPWNFFITANDYWMYKFRNTSLGESYDANNKTELQVTFTSYLAIASKAPFVMFLVINAAVSHRVRPHHRILIPLIVSLLLFIVTTVFTKVDTDSAQRQFLIVTLISVVIINIVGGFYQGGTLGVASCLPTKYMAANVKGQAFGGVIAAAAQIATLALDSSSTTNALAYFLIAVATWVTTLLAFIVTSRMIWPFAVSCVLVFWITLSVFPAVTVLIVPNSYPDGTQWADKYFIPVTCFLIFNVGDLLGRLLAGWIPIAPKHRYLILILCVARIVFIPLFMYCNMQPRQHTEVFFIGDYWFIIFMAAFSVTNGYLCTDVFTAAPKAVEVQYQSIAGSIMAIMLGLGLMAGSLSSYKLIHLI